MNKNILLTYEVTTAQNEVKEALKVIGYSDKKYGHSSETNFKLPQNTMWKEVDEISTTVALTELNAIVTLLNKQLITEEKIEVVKAIAVFFFNWSALDLK